MKFRKTAGLTAAVIMAFAAGPAAFTETVSAEYSRVAVHDPSVVKLDDGSYYIIGSHLAAARSKDLIISGTATADQTRLRVITRRLWTTTENCMLFIITNLMISTDFTR